MIARMYVVLTVLGFLPVMIVWQILGIDIADGQMLREKGKRQASSLQEIPALRGTIYDRAGRTLAVNTTRYDLGVDPTVQGYAAKANILYAELAAITGRSSSAFRAKVSGRSSQKYALLSRDLSERQMERIRELGVPGVRPDPTFARRYNHQSTFAHVLGHVDTDLVGLAGIEKQYDRFLTGTPGKRIRKRDRRGVTTASVAGDDVSPRHGESIVLTIDLVRQSIVEEELARGVAEAGATWGVAAAMNPRTGEILALSNVPTYDPNRPGAFSSAERRNRAVTDQIEPGSTFKLVSAVTALEEKVAALSDTVDTGKGWHVFGGRTMRDTHAHGKITLLDAIALSSNVGIAKTALKVEPGDLYQRARDMGFGQPTYVDLPGEVAGRLKKPSEWSGTSRTSISIGYEVTATPLQILASYAALANDGLLVQPYVVAERRDFEGNTVWKAKPDSVRRAFKARTARKLKPAFEEVVLSGTAKRAQIDGLRIAGKTGTAHKVIEGQYRRDKSRATFVGFFPVEDPQVALIVVMDEPETSSYGGVVSAPVFQRIAQRWIPTLPQAPGFFNDAAASTSVRETTVPLVEGKPLAIAQSQITAAGYYVKASSVEPESVVRRQSPRPGEVLEHNQRVELVSATDDAADQEWVSDVVDSNLMPNLKGLGVRQAVYWLSTKGITAKIEGNGTIARQYPAPGKPVAREATLVAR
ncbi:MAG: PASTA domain-containing protein [Rhodothermales bacterium]|nr:PASTA domain-containing protein [Rhodothermales bacterium]